MSFKRSAMPYIRRQMSLLFGGVSNLSKFRTAALAGSFRLWSNEVLIQKLAQPRSCGNRVAIRPATSALRARLALSPVLR